MEAERTPTTVVQEALQQLPSTDNVRLILNKSTHRPKKHGYYSYGYGYGYGERSRQV